MKLNLNPLIVDLDGTLIKTDMLFESANSYLKRNVFGIFKIIVACFKGKNTLKAMLASQFAPDFSKYPINIEVVTWLKAEKKRGRTIILATASHEKIALQAAKYFDLFDEVLATNDSRNLKSVAKRDLLVEKFGEKAFDYIGDAAADKPVWQAARYAHVVSPSRSILAWLQKNTSLKNIFHPKKQSLLKPLMRALRPHQWAKNFLIFVPLLTAHLYLDIVLLWSSIIAFMVFSILASSVYLLNDLVDIADDRHHPRKCKRPFASGQLSLLTGWLAWPLLMCLAFAIAAFFLPSNFMIILLIYYLTTILYSFYFKSQPIIDVMLLTGLYTLRIIAGAAAINITASFWLLSFSLLIFLSLAFMKRANEIKSILHENNSEQILRGRGYAKEDFSLIVAMGVVAGFTSVVFMALYVHSSEITQYYTSPELIWLTCPLLLFWITRAWFITHRGHMDDDPVLFALKDKSSWLIGGLFIALFAIARFAA